MGLRLVFADLPKEARFAQIQALLDEQTQKPEALAGLFVVREGNDVLGAILARRLAGAAAFVWPPRLKTHVDESISDLLLAAANAWCRNQGVTFAQALPAETADSDHARLKRGDFRYLADLIYLLCPESKFSEAISDLNLEFESHSEMRHERFARVVEATYQQSLDCPAMDRLRKVEEVLEGYRATGVYDPRLWLLVRSENLDVGCLILADDPAGEYLELIYMGVKFPARGRRLGLAIVRHAQYLAKIMNRRRIVLSVDAQNVPAIAMYEAAGFVAWDRRPVFVNVLHEQS